MRSCPSLSLFFHSLSEWCCWSLLGLQENLLSFLEKTPLGRFGVRGLECLPAWSAEMDLGQPGPTWTEAWMPAPATLWTLHTCPGTTACSGLLHCAFTWTWALCSFCQMPCGGEAPWNEIPPSLSVREDSTLSALKPGPYLFSLGFLISACFGKMGKKKTFLDAASPWSFFLWPFFFLLFFLFIIFFFSEMDKKTNHWLMDFFLLCINPTAMKSWENQYSLHGRFVWWFSNIQRYIHEEKQHVSCQKIFLFFKYHLWTWKKAWTYFFSL